MRKNAPTRKLCDALIMSQAQGMRAQAGLHPSTNSGERGVGVCRPKKNDANCLQNKRYLFQTTLKGKKLYMACAILTLANQPK
jgi:hypothetical protein